MDAMGPTDRSGLESRAPDYSRFSRPGDVVEYPALPSDQKRRILLDWLQDEFALMVADNEGMVGRSPRADQVLAALQTLGQATEAWSRSPWPAM